MLAWTEVAYFVAGVVLVPLIKLAIWRLEIYDDRDVIALNAVSPRTRWFNLGFWKPGVQSFPEAAAELCLETARRAQLSRGDRVLEVGSGYGDSAELLSRTFALGSYLGVTAVPFQVSFATDRATELGLNAQFKLGDAVAETEALSSSSLDAILAIDCAYHFQRDRWLRSAHRALDAGGRLALNDLLLPRPLSLLESLIIRFIFLMAGVPFRNLKSPERYEATLREQGWTEIRLEDVSSSVYPGFVRFMESHGSVMGRAFVAWGGLQSYARVVSWYSDPKRPRLAFYMISARKGPDVKC